MISRDVISCLVVGVTDDGVLSIRGRICGGTTELPSAAILVLRMSRCHVDWSSIRCILAMVVPAFR